MTRKQIKERLDQRRDQSAEQCIKQIDDHIERLQLLRAGVIKWNAGEAGPEPRAYGNSFGKVIDLLAEFRERAYAAAAVSEDES